MLKRTDGDQPLVPGGLDEDDRPLMAAVGEAAGHLGVPPLIADPAMLPDGSPEELIAVIRRLHVKLGHP